MQAVCDLSGALARGQMTQRKRRLGQVFDRLGRVVGRNQRIRTRRGNRGARRHQVHRDVILFQLRGKTLCEAMQRGLQRRVHRRAAVACKLVEGTQRRQRGHRADIDDPAATTLAQMGNRRAAEHERYAEIMVHHLLEGCILKPFHAGVLCQPRIVHQDIETTAHLRCTLDQGVALRRIIEIAAQRNGAPAGRLDQRHRLRQGSGRRCRSHAARRHHHESAGTRQTLRNRAANAPAGASDQCRAPGKRRNGIIHRVFSSWADQGRHGRRAAGQTRRHYDASAPQHGHGALCCRAHRVVTQEECR